MNSLFGITHQLDVGVIDAIEDDVVELTFARDFGGLARGTTLRYKAAGNEHSRAYLPLVPTTAEVIATDAHGRPAITRRAAGDNGGAIILCAYSLEHMAAVTPRVNPDATVTLYGALAASAGVRRPVWVNDPRVTCDSLVRDDGARFAVLASHAAEPLDVKPVLGDGGTLAAVDGADCGGAVTLDAFGVKVLRW
jgi:hypothetical protein